MRSSQHLRISRIKTDFPITELDHRFWSRAEAVSIGTYWSGEPAPAEKHAKVFALWSEKAVYFRFEAVQSEPYNVNESFQVDNETDELWERDVCEVFIAPRERNRYFEFEVSPQGEWLDLAIELRNNKRYTDKSYKSAFTSSAKRDEKQFTLAMRIDFEALNSRPSTGDTWSGNLFRIVGSGKERGFLTWRPTNTEVPNFHVPDSFGEFLFAE